MKAFPLVTVYVPCRNYGQFLGKALDSVGRQLYSNWELFVVDEASEDDTLAVANRFKLSVSQRVEIIGNESVRGLQQIANGVLALAQGKYFVRLDADDWFDESALLIMVSKLESDPKVGLVYGNYFYVDEDGEVLGFERRYLIENGDASYHLPPHGACTLVRTKLLKAVGGYSEDVNAQDGWELWFKLIQRARVASLQAPIFYYRQHGKSLSRDTERLAVARAKIFSNILGLQKSKGYKPSCLAVIPVKESYPELEHVPYIQINGKSLLQMAIEEVQKSEFVTDVIISSASSNVLQFAEQLVEAGIISPVMTTLRTFEKDTDTAIHPIDILLGAADEYVGKYGYKPDLLLFLNLHATSRKYIHIDQAVNFLLMNQMDSVVSVSVERELIFRYKSNGLKLLNPGRFKGISYERERLFRYNGEVIAVWTDLVEDGSLLGENIGHVETGSGQGAPLSQSTLFTISR